MLKISMKAARVNANLTQKQMADLMDKSQSTVMFWEQGKKVPRVDELQQFCAICGCDPSDISFA
jgi:transcriptional regulator with XRE-family HTH domain